MLPGPPAAVAAAAAAAPPRPSQFHAAPPGFGARQLPSRQGVPQRGARPSGGRGGKEDVFQALASACDLEPAWRPQVLLLHDLGLRSADFQRLGDSRPEIFQMGIVTMRRKIKFFQDTIGLSNAELTKVVVKFPRILEYKSERTIRPRLEFLRRCGVGQEDLAKVFIRAPMALELRVRDTLEPRADFLRNVLSLSSGALGKLIVRHPQVLTCTEDMMQQRVDFLLQQGLSQAELGRAVLAHPQVLHYKIDSMQERVNFLLSIGLDRQQVASCVARFPQLFSLNVEANLGPKWRYLVDFLRASPEESVATLCSYPAYFSLSLTNRVVPRHRFFLHMQAKSAGKQGSSSSKPGGGGSSKSGGGSEAIFPTNLLKCSDTQFCTQLGATQAQYDSFRQQLFGVAAQPGSHSDSDSDDER
ncbi:hypothetical protein ABPG77_003034 [Micractinium sp. CCAP 211/92]